MAEVSMPRLSDTMEEGTIASWLKQPGEQITKGEVIAQIETDKATMDLTAFETGTLEEILAPAGTTVAIGQPVARIGNGRTKPAAPAAAKSAPPANAAPPATDAAPPVDAPEPGGQTSGTDLLAAQSNPPADGPSPTGKAVAPPDDSFAVSSGTADASAPTGRVAAPAHGSSAASSGTADASAPTGRVAAPAHGSSAAASSRPVAAEAAEGAEEAHGRDGQGGKVRASPLARHLAAEHEVDLSKLSGSGPHGRVIRADVEAAIESPPPAGDAAAAAQHGPASEPARDGASEAGAGSGGGAGDGDERVVLSQMRRTIARRMAESTSTVPHFFLTTTVDASELVKLRKQILEQTAEAGVKITFNDLVVKGAALALRSVPDVNVSFAGDSLIRHHHIHIGIAVATDRGLIVPVLRDVDQKSLGEINRQTADLAERARTGKLQPPDYSGGTFTISNLGMFGVEQFNPVINPPEAAILAVGAIVRQPAEHDGQIVLRDQMKLTLSVDHRALDGAMGARYLQALKQLLEKPMLLLV